MGESQLDEMGNKVKKPEDRIIVLCIAYHNIAVEQEFLKQVQFPLLIFNLVLSIIKFIC